MLQKSLIVIFCLLMLSVQPAVLRAETVSYDAQDNQQIESDEGYGNDTEYYSSENENETAVEEVSEPSDEDAGSEAELTNSDEELNADPDADVQ